MASGNGPVILPADVIADLMQEVFAQGGSYELVVTGASMSPTLKPGRDAVRLVSAKNRRIRKGDILYARRYFGGYMLHRVVKILPDGYTLNGDGQQWVEDVSIADTLGIVTDLRRNGRWISADNPVYRLYVWVWRFTRPYRDSLVALKKKLTGRGRK